MTFESRDAGGGQCAVICSFIDTGVHLQMSEMTELSTKTNRTKSIQGYVVLIACKSYWRKNTFWKSKRATQNDVLTIIG